MKTIKKTHLLIFVALALVLAACAPSPAVIPQTGEEPQAAEDIAGKCLRNSDEERLFINFVHGYCVRYPAEYDIAYPNQSEIMLIKRSILNVEDPRVHITVKLSEGTTIEQAADQIEADYAIPGMDVVLTDLTISGEPAIMLDGLSGQDPNRQVVVIHGDNLYHLYFSPLADKQTDVYKKVEALYKVVIESFTFRTQTNACPDCPEEIAPEGATAEPTASTGEQLEADPKTAIISGWVWHDVCASGKDGEPQPESTPQGCVQEENPLGAYHADGVMAADEPLIEGVVVSLGEDACPSTGLAEQSTINSDLSYSFTDLSAGTYCVSIDPQREPTFSILRPGVWTYPAISQDVNSATVTLAAGEYKGMVNFGWDHQFMP
jgi:hypothetical protein